MGKPMATFDGTLPYDSVQATEDWRIACGRAAVKAARWAHDAGDYLMLLDILGLTVDDARRGRQEARERAQVPREWFPTLTGGMHKAITIGDGHARVYRALCSPSRPLYDGEDTGHRCGNCVRMTSRQRA